MKTGNPKKLFFFIILLTLLQGGLITPVFSQDPDDPGTDPPPPVGFPIDNNIIYLVGAAILYGAVVVKKNLSKKEITR